MPPLNRLPPEARRRTPVPPAGGDSGEWLSAQGSVRDLGDAFGVLRRRYRAFLIGFLSVVAVVAVATWLWPRSYESVATVLVERRTPAMEGLERIAGKSPAEMETELIRSRRVFAAVVDQFDWHVQARTEGDWRPAAEWFESVAAGPDLEPAAYRIEGAGAERVARHADTGEIAAEGGGVLSLGGLTLGPRRDGLGDPVELRVIPFARAVTELGKRIDVGQVARELDLVRVACRSDRPETARDLCEAVLSSYITLRQELQTSDATATFDYLHQEVASVEKQLRAAEDSLGAFARRNALVGNRDTSGEEARRNGVLRAQREQLQMERSALTRFLDDLDNRNTGGRQLAGYPTFFKSEPLTELLLSLIELENRRSDLALLRTERSPDLAALDSRIVEVNQRLADLARSYKEGLDSQIASLDRTLSDSRQRLSEIPEAAVESARLERRVTMLDELYRAMQGKLSATQVAEAIRLPGIDVVDRPFLPDRPATPNIPLNLVLACLFGLGYGGALVLFREFTDRTVRGISDIEMATGLPVLTQIPQLHRVGLLGRSNGASTPLLAAANAAADTDVTPAVEVPRLHVLARESFHTLASDLGFAARRIGAQTRSIVVTGTTRGEGKTFTACNLALVRAAAGARTLLIDADLRGGTVSRFFRIPPQEPTLHDLIDRRDHGAGRWKDVFQAGPALWVIPCGDVTADAPRLLGSAEFAELLAAAQTDFDFVIVDTPPLALVADAMAPAVSVDGVVLVVREGLTDSATLRNTLVRLERAGISVIGVVFNGTTLTDDLASFYDYSRKPSS